MKKTVLVCLLLLGIALMQATPFNLQRTTGNNVSISFDLPQYKLKPVDGFNQIEFATGTLPGSAALGQPDLPMFSTYVALPAGCTASVSMDVSELSTYPGVKPAPSMGLDETQSVLRADEAAYQQLIKPSAAMGKVEFMRSLPMARLVIKPFGWDPETGALLVAKKVNLTVSFNQDVRAPRATRTGIMPPAGLLSTICVNPGLRMADDTELPGSYVFVYSGEASVYNLIAPFANFKRWKGYNVKIMDISTLDNSNSLGIKAALVQAWRTWEIPPAYICLVGDVDADNYNIPSFEEEHYGESVPGDNPYGLLEGDDLLPEAFVGRLSFDSLEQLGTIITKTMRMEMLNSQQNPTFLDRSLLIGDPGQSGVSTILTMEYIDSLVSEYNPQQDIVLIETEPFANRISDQINQGVGTVFYRGFYGTSGFNLSNNSVEQLTNIGKLPFASFITCHTALFTTERNLVEEIVRAGTAASPKGAVAAVGSSSSTHTCFNNIITSGMAYGMYKQGLSTPGQILARGKLALYENYPENPSGSVDWYSIGKVLMGDPGMTLFFKQPKSIDMHYDVPATGANSLQVKVTDQDNQPQAGIRVTISQDNAPCFASAVTNAQGTVTLAFEPLQNGNAVLTAWSPSHYLNYASLTIGQASAALRVNRLVLPDTGITPGQENQFGLVLYNSGNTATGAFTLSMSAQSGQLQQQVEVGSINALDSLLVNGITYQPSWAGSHSQALTLNATINQVEHSFYAQIPVNWPELNIQGLVVNSQPSELQPGQLNQLEVLLANNGTIASLPINATITCLNDDVILDTAAATYAAISVDEAGASINPFEITVQNTIIPGTTIDFTLHLQDNLGYGYQLDLPFSTSVGQTQVTDPTLPDAYGYVFTDDGDTGWPMCPEYQWEEVDPRFSGVGQRLGMVDREYGGGGDSRVIDIGFHFSFYGESYNKITVCSNGFMMPGEHNDVIDWMNFELPGPMVPRPIIAPFWDDLLTDTGDAADVCVWADSTAGRLLVQWSRMLNKYDNSRETFQAILYDYSYGTTNTGDNLIKFQYYTIHNVDEGTYGTNLVYHGEYATVGVADHSGMLGSTYTYGNQYAPGAAALHGQMAILVGGTPTIPQAPYISLARVNLADSNSDGIVNNGETVSLFVNLYNRGASAASNVNATLSADSPYITVTSATASYGNINGQESSAANRPYVLQVSPTCPNNTLVTLTLTATIDDREPFVMHTNFKVVAPELVYNGMSYDDADDQLEAGESGVFSFTLGRRSNLNCGPVSYQVSSQTDEFVFPTASGTFVDDGSDELTFMVPVQMQETAINGNTVVVDIAIEYQGYTKTFSPSYITGHPDELFWDGFSETSTHGTRWLSNPGTYSNTSFAGGQPPEYAITTNYLSPRLLPTISLDSFDVQKYIISFDYRAEEYNQSYELYARSANSQQLVWSVLPSDSDAHHVRIEFEAPDWEAINFVWSITDSQQNGWIYLDNVSISGVRHSQGTIAGTVTVNQGIADFTQCSITNIYSSTQTNANGEWLLNAYAGDYDVYISMPGYRTHCQREVAVSPGQTTQLDAQLLELPIPTNLTHRVEGNTHTLNWDLEYDSDLFELLYYKVYKKYYYQGDTTVNYVVCNVNQHTWVESIDLDCEVYVTAVYDMNDESRVSDSILTDEDDPLAPQLQFAMQGAVPNPFNPTTTINYTLPQAQHCNLKVYDLKGRVVATLVNQIQAAGKQKVVWNGNDTNGRTCASGIYLLRLDAGPKKAVQKVMLLK